jgi:hypothetical protein
VVALTATDRRDEGDLIAISQLFLTIDVLVVTHHHRCPEEWRDLRELLFDIAHDIGYPAATRERHLPLRLANPLAHDREEPQRHLYLIGQRSISHADSSKLKVLS